MPPRRGKFCAKLPEIFHLCNFKKDKKLDTMGNSAKPNFFARVVDLYLGGFREMTVGRKLWAIILIKLAIMFLVFKIFFFPDLLKENYADDASRARAVRTALTGS